MKNKLKWFIPFAVFLILPWTHRLLVMNATTALPWVGRSEAETWLVGLSGLWLFIYGFITFIN